MPYYIVIGGVFVQYFSPLSLNRLSSYKTS